MSNNINYKQIKILVLYFISQLLINFFINFVVYKILYTK